MRKFLAPFAVLLCGLMFQSGCTGPGAIIVTGLHVELAGVERAADGTVTVAWRIMNPNVAPYLLSRVSQKIYLNETLVGTTVDVEPMAVPAQDHAGRKTRLSLAGPAAERLIADAAGHDAVSYRVDAELLIQLYGDTMEKGDITGAGSVKVTAK